LGQYAMGGSKVIHEIRSSTVKAIYLWNSIV
jgi:hypothetical protein